MSREEELRRVLAQCYLQEKLESGEAVPPPGPARRNCPYCDERISVAARKCPCCQSILDKSLLPGKDILDYAAMAVIGAAKLLLWFVLFFVAIVALMFLVSR